MELSCLALFLTFHLMPKTREKHLNGPRFKPGLASTTSLCYIHCTMASTAFQSQLYDARSGSLVILRFIKFSDQLYNSRLLGRANTFEGLQDFGRKLKRSVQISVAKRTEERKKVDISDRKKFRLKKTFSRFFFFEGFQLVSQIGDAGGRNSGLQNFRRKLSSATDARQRVSSDRWVRPEIFGDF